MPEILSAYLRLDPRPKILMPFISASSGCEEYFSRNKLVNQFLIPSFFKKEKNSSCEYSKREAKQ